MTHPCDPSRGLGLVSIAPMRAPKGQRIRMTGRVATMSWCYRPGLLRESGVSVSCGWWPRTGPVKVAQLVAQLGCVPGLCQVLSVWLDCQKTGRLYWVR